MPRPQPHEHSICPLKKASFQRELNKSQEARWVIAITSTITAIVTRLLLPLQLRLLVLLPWRLLVLLLLLTGVVVIAIAIANYD